MTSYAAFLRGINLGPTNRVAMPELRRAAEAAGLSEVRTHLNSGNLLFTSTATRAALERQITDLITTTFGLSIDVTVRSRAQLAAVVANNPFPDGNPSQVTVAFLTKPAPPTAAERVAAVARDYEPVVFAGEEVYVHYSRGIGTSKLAEQFSRIIGVSSTVRNIRTVTKVLELLEG